MVSRFQEERKELKVWHRAITADRRNRECDPSTIKTQRLSLKMLLPIPKAAGPGAQGQLVEETAQSTNHFDDSGSMPFKNTGQVILKLSKIRQFLSMES